MIYTYYCSQCEKEFDATQSIHDEALTKCHLCGCDSTIHRVITGGLPPIIRLGEGDIKTLGHLAARHSDTWSPDYIRHLDEKNATRKESGERALPSGMERIKPQSGEKPWWDKPEFNKASDAEITKMTPEQKEKYIMEGTK